MFQGVRFPGKPDAKSSSPLGPNMEASKFNAWDRSTCRFTNSVTSGFLEFNLHHPRLGKPAAALLSGSLTKAKRA